MHFVHIYIYTGNSSRKHLYSRSVFFITLVSFSMFNGVSVLIDCVLNVVIHAHFCPTVDDHRGCNFMDTICIIDNKNIG